MLDKNNSSIYKEVVENAKDIILVLDSEGRIIEANKLAVESYGYDYNELVGLSIFEIRGQDNTEIARMQFSRAKTDGVEFETVHYRKDGSGFPVEVKSVGVEDASGHYVASIIRDITNRNKRLEEIKVLASIVESSDSAIIGTTLDGRITSWNKGAVKLYGYTKAEALGKSATMIIPSESGDNLDRILSKIRDGGKIERHKTIRKRKDGSFIRVSLSISPIYGMDGTITGVSAIANDITEKSILTERLNKHEERWKFANELTNANAFQASLMFTVKKFEMADMYGKYIPSSIVGGDLYDCVNIGNSLWFIIADVAGHGFVSAMVSAMVKGIFNNCIHNNTYPNEVLENMNSILFNILGDDNEHLVSAFIGLIRNGRLYYSNAGHPYPVVINTVSGIVNILEQNGFLLAMQTGTKYELEQKAILQNDIIILYTDGLFTSGTQNQIYWNAICEGAIQIIESYRESQETFVQKLIQSFRTDENEDFEDDVSVMLISLKTVPDCRGF